jgi:hypothetical protein
MGLTKNNDIVTLLTQISALKEQVEALQAEVFKKEPEEPEQPNWEEVRVKRDKLLKESDWTMIPGVTVDQRAWSAYRQVLRDLPQTYGPNNLTKIVWPQNPPIAGPNTTPVE